MDTPQTKQNAGAQAVQVVEEQSVEMIGSGPAKLDEVCAFLLESERLAEADLKRAETYREQHGGDLITLLVRLGLVSERDVAEAESTLLKLPLMNTADLPEEGPEVGSLSRRYLKQNLLLPIKTVVQLKVAQIPIPVTVLNSFTSLTSISWSKTYFTIALPIGCSECCSQLPNMCKMSLVF